MPEELPYRNEPARAGRSRLQTFTSLAHYVTTPVPRPTLRCGSSVSACASRDTTQKALQQAPQSRASADARALNDLRGSRPQTSNPGKEALRLLCFALLSFTRHRRGESARAAQMSYTIFSSGKTMAHTQTISRKAPPRTHPAKDPVKVTKKP